MKLPGATIFIMLIGGAWLASEGQVIEYSPVGSTESASLERELRYKMPGYNCAFWPRPEVLANAISGRLVPPEYIESIKSWFPRVLNPALVQASVDPNSILDPNTKTWLGVPNLHWNRNYVIGRFILAHPN